MPTSDHMNCETLAWFQHRMAEKLSLPANVKKPNWRKTETEFLRGRLLEECDELASAIRAAESVRNEENCNAVIREAADVANFAMMIADKHRCRQ